ncbi:hypothetical protein GmHk_06G014721 [Glycine max]|nr:hypothetical protein GmHk_06G014721 [Glycine max]
MQTRRERAVTLVQIQRGVAEVLRDLGKRAPTRWRHVSIAAGSYNGDEKNPSSGFSQLFLPHPEVISSLTSTECRHPSTTTFIVLAKKGLSFVRTKTRAISILLLSSVAWSSSINSPHDATMSAKCGASHACSGTPQMRSHVKRYDGFIAGDHFWMEEKGVTPSSFQPILILHPFETYKTISMALFVPLLRNENLPYFSPLLEDLPEFLFSDRIREMRKVKGGYVWSVPPRTKCSPSAIDMPIGSMWSIYTPCIL